MKKHLLLSCLVIFLSGCGPTATAQIPRIIPPTHTQTTTKMPSATPNITPTETPTPRPTPRNILIELYHGAGDGVDEITICMAVYSPFPRLILYEDGQLVFYNENHYKEAHLSKEKINSLLEKIEATGYFKLGDSFKEHYDFPKDIELGGGGWGKHISVKGKTVDVEPAVAKYLLKPVTDTLNIIESYLPPNEDTKTYIPKKIHLTIIEASTGSYFPTPNPLKEIKEWPVGLFKLNSSYERDLSQYEIDALSKLDLYISFPELRLFKQDGIIYYVLGCLPWYEEIK